MADTKEEKEKQVESNPPQTKAAQIDSAALSDKPRAGGAAGQDIDMQVLDGVKRKENQVRETTSVPPLALESNGDAGKNETNKIRDGIREINSNEGANYRHTLTEGAKIFFDRSINETERLIAVRDSYDRIASLLPKTEAAPIIKQGRELLSINAADGLRECLSKFGTQDTTEKDNQELIKRLKELNRLAQVEPPGETARQLVETLGGQKQVEEVCRKLAASDSVTQIQAVRDMLTAFKTGPNFLEENLLADKVQEARNSHLFKRVGEIKQDERGPMNELLNNELKGKNLSCDSRLQLENMLFFNRFSQTLGNPPKLNQIMDEAVHGNPHARAQLAILSLGNADPDNPKAIKELREAHEKQWGVKLPDVNLWQNLTPKEQGNIERFAREFLIAAAGLNGPGSAAETTALVNNFSRATDPKTAAKLEDAILKNAEAKPLEASFIPGTGRQKIDGLSQAIEASEKLNNKQIETLNSKLQALIQDRLSKGSPADKAETQDIMSVLFNGAGLDKGAKVEKIQSREPGADRAVQVTDRNGEISQYHFKGNQLLVIKEGGKPLPTGSAIEFATLLRKPQGAIGVNDNWLVVQAPGHKTGEILRQTITLDEKSGKVTREKSGEKLVYTGGAAQESADGEKLKLKLESGVQIEGTRDLKEPTSINYPDGTRIEALGNGKFRELKPGPSGKQEELRSFSAVWSMNGDKPQLVSSEQGRTEIFRTDSRIAISANGQEMTITQANGKAIRVGGLDASGNPNKIYTDKNDGTYAASEDGKLWRTYDKDGKLIDGQDRNERVVLDVNKGTLSFIKVDGSGALKKSFDGSEKEYKNESDGTPTSIVERRQDGTIVSTDFTNGKRTATTEERQDGSMRIWQHLLSDNANLDGMTLLVKRRTSRENGSSELTLTYALSDKPDGLPFVSSYTDKSGKWQLKGNADGSAEYFANEARGEARAEKVFMGQDGRMEKLAMVQSDVIGLGNEDQRIKVEIGMDGVTLGTLETGNLIRGDNGLVSRTVSATGQTTDFEYNEAGWPMKITENKNGQIKVWQATGANMSTTWRSSADESQMGGWRISKNTGEQLFVFDAGHSYRKTAGADKWDLTDDGANARAKVKGLFSAYEDYYLTSHRRAEALKNHLEGMTPDQIYKFRRDFAEKYRDDFPSFGHYLGWKFGESAEGQTLSDMINPRARTYTELDAERSAINLRGKLNELGESGWFKRSEAQISAEMRRCVADMSQKELNEMNRLYSSRYFRSALDDVETRPEHQRSEEVHKEAMQLYLTTGTDKRTAEQEKHLMETSLKACGQFATVSLGDEDGGEAARQHNREISKTKLELFKEFSGRASKDARSLFLKDDGDKKLEAGLVPEESREADSKYKFENSIFANLGDAGRIMTIGRDYARDGKTSVATKIEEENWGSGPSQDRMNQIFEGMDRDERAKFRLGFELTADLRKPELVERTKSLLNAQTSEGERAREALAYYDALSKKCHDLHWFNKNIKESRYMQAAYGAGLGSELDKHSGPFLNAGAQKFMKSVEDMDSSSYRNLLGSPNLRNMLYKQIEDRFGTDKDARRAEQLLKDKLAFGDRLLAPKGGPTDTELMAYKTIWKEKPELFQTFQAGKNEAAALAAKTPAEREKRLSQLAETSEGKAILKSMDYFYSQAYELASSQVRRDILDVIKDNRGSGKEKVSAVIDATIKMSDAQRQKYENDPSYRKQVEDELNTSLASPYGRDAVKALLRQVEANGDRPHKNAIVSLFERAAQGPSIAEGFKILNSTLSTEEGAKLRAQLNKESPNFDPALRANFDRAMQAVFQTIDPETNETQVLLDLDKSITEPTIANGIVPVKQMLQYMGARSIVESFANISDEKSALANLTERQKKDLLSDLENSLSNDQNKLVTKIVEQGYARPEDKLRNFVLNPSNEDALWNQLGSLNLTDQVTRQKLSQDYSRKFDNDLVTDLISKVAYKDRARIEAALHSDAWTLAHSLDHAKQFISKVDDYAKDWGWDSTRLQMEESLNRFSQAKREADKDHQKLSETEIAEHQRRVFTDAGAHIGSQEARADAIADTVILASAAAATVMTGGAASPLLIAAFTAGSAGFKFGTTAYLTDGKMDMRTGNVMAKLASGAVNGFTGVFGPAEIAACLKLGTGAATRATGEVLSHEAFAGLSAAARKELQDTLAKNLAQSLQHQIVSGISKSEAELIKGAIAKTAERGLLNTEQSLIASEILKESVAKSIAAEGRAMLVTKSLALSQTSGVSGAVLGTATQMGIAGKDMSYEDLRDSILRGSLGAFGGHLAGMSAGSFSSKLAKEPSFVGKSFDAVAAPTSLILGMTGANFTAENLVAAMRQEGYSGEGLNHQVINAAWAPLFQHLRARVESHSQTTHPSLRAALHSESEAPANQRSTGHTVLHKLEADHIASRLAELEDNLAKQRASLAPDDLVVREQEIRTTREQLKSNLVNDAADMLATTLGIPQEKASEIAAKLLELHDHQGSEIAGFFSPQEGNVNLYVGSQLMNNSRPGQTNLHEFAHLADAARYQALYDANPRLFIETLVNDCVSGSFSKGRARLETEVFGEGSFERKVASQHGFTKEDINFARTQLKDYLAQNSRDGKLPPVPEASELHKWILKRGAEFPNNDYAQNQKLIFEMRREISNARVTFANTRFSEEALTKPAVEALVDATRANMGDLTTKAPFQRMLSGVSDATMGLSHDGLDYYLYGSRYENSANRIQYSRALQAAIRDYPGLLENFQKELAGSLTADKLGHSAKFMQTLGISNISELPSRINSVEAERAVFDLAINKEAPPALREAATKLGVNIESALEAHKALTHLTALDMLNRDGARLREAELNGSPQEKTELQAKVKSWAKQALSTIQEGEAEKLASYLVRRDIMSEQELRELSVKPGGRNATLENLQHSKEPALQYSLNRNQSIDSQYLQSLEQRFIEGASTPETKKQRQEMVERLSSILPKDEGTFGTVMEVAARGKLTTSDLKIILEDMATDPERLKKFAIALKQLNKVSYSELPRHIETAFKEKSIADANLEKAQIEAEEIGSKRQQGLATPDDETRINKEVAQRQNEADDRYLIFKILNNNERTAKLETELARLTLVNNEASKHVDSTTQGGFVTQTMFTDYLKTIVDEKNKDLEKPRYKLFEGHPTSGADQAHMDVIIVDRKTGNYVVIDIKQKSKDDLESNGKELPKLVKHLRADPNDSRLDKIDYGNYKSQRKKLFLEEVGKERVFEDLETSPLNIMTTPLELDVHLDSHFRKQLSIKTKEGETPAWERALNDLTPQEGLEEARKLATQLENWRKSVDRIATAMSASGNLDMKSYANNIRRVISPARDNFAGGYITKLLGAVDNKIKQIEGANSAPADLLRQKFPGAATSIREVAVSIKFKPTGNGFDSDVLAVLQLADNNVPAAEKANYQKLLQAYENPQHPKHKSVVNLIHALLQED